VCRVGPRRGDKRVLLNHRREAEAARPEDPGQQKKAHFLYFALRGGGGGGGGWGGGGGVGGGGGGGWGGGGGGLLVLFLCFFGWRRGTRPRTAPSPQATQRVIDGTGNQSLKLKLKSPVSDEIDAADDVPDRGAPLWCRSREKLLPPATGSWQVRQNNAAAGVQVTMTMC